MYCDGKTNSLESALRYISSHEIDGIFTGFNVSRSGYVVKTLSYPIRIELWEDVCVFSVHFNDDVKKISKIIGGTIEETYRSLYRDISDYSFSIDEDYHMYYSRAIAHDFDRYELQQVLYDLYDVIVVYCDGIREWKRFNLH